MPAPYQHKQRARWIVWSIVPSLAIILLAAYAIGDTFGWILALLITAMMSVIVWLFSSLSVRVDDEVLSWQFGPGFWKKQVARSQIVSVTPVRNKWWYGWGIRLTPHGWLYNIEGLNAVEVRTTDGKTLRVGTDDPQGLVAACAQTGP